MSTASQFNQALQVHLQQQQQMKQSQGSQSNRPVIERGASWSYNETRILLSLWGQDMVQRQLTNSKRTRHVWEKIAERIRVHGFDRTADQVRTRVFNMIAEYRRILKNPTPERKKKCIFFDALHKIYQAKDSNGVRAALNNYEEDYNLEPIDFASGGGNGDENDSNGAEGMMMHMTDANGSMEDMGSDEREEEVFSYAMSPSQTLNGHLNGTHDDDEGEADDSLDETMDYPLVNGPAKRVRSDSNYSLSDHQYQSNEQHHASSQKRLHSVNSGHNNKQHNSFQSQSKRQQPFDQQQQDAVQSFENSSCALLIDRMFAHLGKETEVMKEWVHLERERMAQEVTRRREEKEREERREKAFLSTLTRMQEQMFSYLSKQSSVDESNGHHASSALSSQSSPCNNNVNSAVDDGLESS